jgi:hypothetical protein
MNSTQLPREAGELGENSHHSARIQHGNIARRGNHITTCSTELSEDELHPQINREVSEEYTRSSLPSETQGGKREEDKARSSTEENCFC